MTENPETCNNPMCIVHDTNRHWVDDYAYTDPDLAAIDETTPDAKKMLDVLSKYFNQLNNPSVYRFALVWVNHETGLIDAVGNPGSDEHTTTNLLARGIALLAYQASLKQVMGLTQALKTVINSQYGKDMPGAKDDEYIVPYGRRDDDGLYL
jgi:hypothetical protein